MESKKFEFLSKENDFESQKKSCFMHKNWKDHNNKLNLNNNDSLCHKKFSSLKEADFIGIEILHSNNKLEKENPFLLKNPKSLEFLNQQKAPFLVDINEKKEKKGDWASSDSKILKKFETANKNIPYNDFSPFKYSKTKNFDNNLTIF